ncbi:MAG: putative Peptidase [Acidobacteria bacterium]|nr:putative Peptidase [Acidobacteriota bacterium]
MRRKTRELAEAVMKPLIAGGLTVLALEVARRVFRHTQLFCPEIAPLESWNPGDYGIPPERVSEEWMETPDGEQLFGWYCRADKPIASAVFCHGNTGNLTNVAAVIPHLMDAGFNVLLFDYRGFGRSTGHPSLSGVVSDGITAARFHDRIRPKGLPSILYGFSLGGAVAAQVIRHHRFDGLILQSTFTTLPELARAVWPRLPLHHFSGNFFDTLSVIRKLQVPLLVLHGTADEVIPCSMAHALYDACPGPKRMYSVEGGLHKDLFVRDGEALVFAANQFVANLPRKITHTIEPPTPTELAIDGVLRYLRRHLRRRPQPASAHQTL